MIIIIGEASLQKYFYLHSTNTNLKHFILLRKLKEDQTKGNQRTIVENGIWRQKAIWRQGSIGAVFDS